MGKSVGDVELATQDDINEIARVVNEAKEQVEKIPVDLVENTNIAIDRATIISEDLEQKVADDYFRGAKGNDGYTPIKGIDYFDGDKGEKGERGIQGLNGDKGDTGEQGIPGEKGEKGDDGYTPIKGIDYLDGEKGDDGEQGIPGDKGDDGYTPIKGIDYFDGEKGDAGERGIQGEKGDTGLQGEQGIPGDKGDTGERGIQGEQGLVGNTGAQGLQGVAGVGSTHVAILLDGVEKGVVDKINFQDTMAIDLEGTTANVYYGTTQPTTFGLGDLDDSIFTQDVKFTLKGVTKYINSAYAPLSGMIKSYAFDANGVEQEMSSVTIADMYGWDYIIDNFRSNTTASYVSKYRLSTLPASTAWTYSPTYNAYWCYRGDVMLPANDSVPAYMAFEDFKTESWATFISPSTTTTNTIAFSTSENGKVYFRVAGMTSDATYAAWRNNATNANLTFTYLLRTGTPTPTAPTVTAFTNTIKVYKGGRVAFIPTANRPPVPTTLSFSGSHKVSSSQSDIANALAEAATVTFNEGVGNQPAMVIDCLGNFTVTGLSVPNVVTNPYTNPSSINIPTTNGLLQSFDSAGTLLSTVKVPSLYGTALLKDSLSATDGITRQFSNDFYIKSTWDWQQVTVAGDTNNQTVVWACLLDPIDFYQLPFKNTDIGAAAVLISNKFTVVSEASIVGRASGYLSFGWDNALGKYRICLSVGALTTVNNVASKSKLTYILNEVTKFIIRYKLATPIVDNIPVLDLVLKKGGNVTFATLDKTYAVCNITAATNTNAVIDNQKNISAQTVKNYANNIEILKSRADYISVKEYGAIGDGTIDDTSAIQTAIYLAYQQVGITKAVFVPSGKYLISKTLHIPANVELFGIGEAYIVTTNTGIDMVNIEGSKVYIHNLRFNLPAGSMYSAIRVDAAYANTHVRLKDLTIKGGLTGNTSSERSYGIHFSKGDAMTTYNFFCSVIDCDISYVYYPLYVEDGTTPCMFQNISIDYFVQGITTFSGIGTYTFKGHNRSGYSLIDLYCATWSCTFEGFCYDPQRARYAYYFAPSSKNNHYYNPIFFENNYIMNVSVPEANGDNEPIKGNDTELDYVYDLGLNNVCINQVKPGTVDSFCSSNYATGAGVVKNALGVDVLQINRSNPNMYGMQDNCLAYVDKWATVNINGTNQLANGSKSDLFDIGGGSNGFNAGYTFMSNPDVADGGTPIEIEMIFDTSVKNLNKVGIKFNDYIGQAITIYVRNAVGVWSPYGSTTKNRLSNWSFQIHPDNYEVYGIKIVISKAYYDVTSADPLLHFNKDKKVGISLIWGMSGYSGGNAYLKSGNAQLYGYLGLGSVSALPTATAFYRGKQIVLITTGADDVLYICMQKADGTYYWKPI